MENEDLCQYLCEDDVFLLVRQSTFSSFSVFPITCKCVLKKSCKIFHVFKLRSMHAAQPE